MHNLTIFAIPKAFEGHFAMIQRNAIRTWTLLKPEPDILLFCDDPGVAEAADDFGCTHVPDVRVNEWGTPLVSSMWALAQQMAKTDLVCYVDCDNLLFQDFMQALEHVDDRFDEFLMVGQRWDWMKPIPIKFGPQWDAVVRMSAREAGRMHNPFAMDFFAFPKGVIQIVQPYAVGWYAWDNATIRQTLEKSIPIVDVTSCVFCVHQNHPERLTINERQRPGDNPQRLRNLELAAPWIQIGGGKPGCVTASQWVMRKDGEIVRRSEPGA